MKIICPLCSAESEVQPDVIGQKVECQQCKNQWIAESVPTPISKLTSSLKSASTSKSIPKPNSIFKSASISTPESILQTLSVRQRKHKSAPISTPDSTPESTPHNKKAPIPEMKLCPICGESILAVAKKCRYCGEYLTADFIPIRRRNRGFYCLLGIFFGQLGVHNFYAEQNSEGFTKLFLTGLAGILALVRFELLLIPLVLIFWLTVVDLCYDPNIRIKDRKKVLGCNPDVISLLLPLILSIITILILINNLRIE